MAKSITAYDVAKFFLSAYEASDAGDLVSNMKMQKLVYYAQGIHLAITGKRLFDEDIEAWTHGPVIPSLYRELKRFGDRAISLDVRGSGEVFTQTQKDILQDVFNAFGQYSAWVLRQMTHKEAPWLSVTNDGIDAGNSRVIPDKIMIEYFKTQIED